MILDGRKDRGEGESAASEGEETWASGHRRGVARRGRGSRRWPDMHMRAPRFPSAYWQEEEDGSALGGLGRYSARTGRPTQVTLSLCFLI